MRLDAIANKPPPKEGDERTVRRFLFFPKLLDGQWRWFEFANISQRIVPLHAFVPEGPDYMVLKWVDVSWKSPPMVNGCRPPKPKGQPISGSVSGPKPPADD